MPGIEEQNQALQPCGDILQPQKIQKTGQVVADQTECKHQQPVMRVERLGMLAPDP